MAVVKYGVIVTELKGKIAGQVFQGGNNSYVLRNKGYSKGNSSAARQSANSNVVRPAIRWRSLDEADRATWETAAASWQFTDKYGDTYYGSAYQCFVAWNAGRLLTGGSMVDTAGSVISADAYTGLFFECNDSGTFVLNYDSGITEDQYMLIYMSPPTTAGRLPGNVKKRYITRVRMSIGNIHLINSAYTAIYPDRTAGQWIYYKVEVRVKDYPRAVLSSIGAIEVVV